MQNRFQAQMAFATAFTVLTSGVFLSGLATLLGASDVLVGYLSVIMNICGALILILAPLIERFRSRKRVTIGLTLASKAATVAIVAVPLLVAPGVRLPFFMALIIIAFTLQAQAQVSLNNWLIHFIDADQRGRYISTRMTIGLVMTVVLSVVAGWYVDQAGGGHRAFVVLFLVAAGLALGEILILVRIDDVPVLARPAGPPYQVARDSSEEHPMADTPYHRVAQPSSESPPPADTTYHCVARHTSEGLPRANATYHCVARHTSEGLPRANATYSWKDLLTIPWRNRPFIRFTAYIAAFYCLLYVADSFTIVYLLRYLELSYSQITIIQQVFMSLPQLVLLSVWGRASDRLGHGVVLRRSIWFFVGELLFVMIASQQTALICLPIAYAFAAIANSGFNVSVFNRRYELIPEQARIIHDNFFHAVVGLALILGPAIGGLIKDWVAASPLARDLDFAEFRVLYALSLIGLIILQLVARHLAGDSRPNRSGSDGGLSR